MQRRLDRKKIAPTSGQDVELHKFEAMINRKRKESMLLAEFGGDRANPGFLRGMSSPKSSKIGPGGDEASNTTNDPRNKLPPLSRTPSLRRQSYFADSDRFHQDEANIDTHDGSSNNHDQNSHDIFGSYDHDHKHIEVSHEPPAHLSLTSLQHMTEEQRKDCKNELDAWKIRDLRNTEKELQEARMEAKEEMLKLFNEGLDAEDREKARKESLSMFEIKEGDDVDFSSGFEPGYDGASIPICHQLFMSVNLRLCVILLLLLGILSAIFENSCRKQGKSIAGNCLLP
jgi:hypothetical protein